MYKVEHLFTYGWADAEWQEDNEPLRFTTAVEAQREISDLCDHMGYDPSEYRVVKA